MINYNFAQKNWFRVANLRAHRIPHSHNPSRLNISINAVTLPSMSLWIIATVMLRSLISRRFYGFIRNQEDRSLSNQRYWRARLCWFGIMALCSVLLSLLYPRSLPFHPYPYTILSLETLYYLSSTPNQIRDCECCGGGSRSGSSYSSLKYRIIRA